MTQYKVTIEATEKPPPKSMSKGQVLVTAYDGEGMVASSILRGTNSMNLPLHSIGTRVIDAGDPYGACRQVMDSVIDLR